MCKMPSPHLQKLLTQASEQASVQAAQASVQANRLREANKQAAREQLLRAQLILARNSSK